MKLPVRYPQIDFESCFPKWAPDLEFSMMMNSNSILPAHLEPYIIKVFAQAKPHLDPVRDAALIRELDWFVAQEAQHYRQHVRFNRVFQTSRYPEVEKLGKAYAADLDGFLKNRSLIFNLAYTEGFESGGGVFYRLWFEKLGAFRIGAKDEALKLWDWHYAEEFEHREVAYKIYMAVAARGNWARRIWYGYFYRVYGVLKMIGHGTQYSRPIAQHLLEVERSDMTPAEAAESKKRQKRLTRKLFNMTMGGLLAVLSPFYNPAHKPPPEGLDEVLQQFDTGGSFAKIPAKA